MWTLFGLTGSGSAAIEMALDRCAVTYRVLRTSARLHRYWEIFADQFEGQPCLVRSARPALLATLESIEAHPALAPVFARYWPPR